MNGLLHGRFNNLFQFGEHSLRDLFKQPRGHSYIPARNNWCGSASGDFRYAVLSTSRETRDDLTQRRFQEWFADFWISRSDRSLHGQVVLDV